LKKVSVEELLWLGHPVWRPMVKKIKSFDQKIIFFSCKFFNIFVHQNHEPGSTGKKN
jgi:hypothetical protein